ncbi:hypothetical protein PVAND_014006 [Polypedilum vanderplanki]|uniref:Uncharacterized protein n=1 Tax=Polypedilum vanderplanki TaxID=319348 RepID=A0A9J6CRG7_POLVA|nr:hypothetical protein PVAND_014006 [Polypedilum vanderplanki]
MAESNNLTQEEQWKQQEEAYQAQIANLRKLNEKLLNYSEEKQKTYEHNIQKMQNEKDIIQKRLEKMELDELREAASGTSKNIEAFKEKYDKVLKQAQDLLFERQKTIKSLELKIEAQNIQIESLKDVVSLTKDMLGIREVEIRDLTERMEAMAVKFKAEKDCKALMQKKMQLSDQLNIDMKAEYKAQKEIFEILKDQYKSKVSMLEAKLKATGTPNNTEASTTNGHSEPSSSS